MPCKVISPRPADAPWMTGSHRIPAGRPDSLAQETDHRHEKADYAEDVLLLLRSSRWCRQTCGFHRPPGKGLDEGDAANVFGEPLDHVVARSRLLRYSGGRCGEPGGSTRATAWWPDRHGQRHMDAKHVRRISGQRDRHGEALDETDRQTSGRSARRR